MADPSDPWSSVRDMVDAVFDMGTSKKPNAPPPAPAPGSKPKIRSKTVDGELYVRADDVADMLEQQVPRQAKNFIKILRNGAAKARQKGK